jgi:hypothetical protein
MQAEGQLEITRAQRISYAVQAGLVDDFVRNALQLDVTRRRMNHARVNARY